MYELYTLPNISNLLYTQASREVDNFMRDVAARTPPNKNVEVGIPTTMSCEKAKGMEHLGTALVALSPWRATPLVV